MIKFLSMFGLKNLHTGIPDWLVPKKSPAPLISRSFSAISNPSSELFSIDNRFKVDSDKFSLKTRTQFPCKFPLTILPSTDVTEPNQTFLLFQLLLVLLWGHSLQLQLML